MLSKFSHVAPIENRLGLLLYPIPSQSELKIENKNNSSMHLIVYNSTGKKMSELNINAEELAYLDVSTWSNGIYIISNGTNSTTFAVQH